MAKILVFGLCIVLLAALALMPFAEAYGASAPYWRTNPLDLMPGESHEFAFTLQNMVGGEDVTLKAEVKRGSEIAEIIDASNIYFVPYGSNDVLVNVLVTAPENAQSGEEYDVVLSFTRVNTDDSGMLTLSTGMEKLFKVKIGDMAAYAEVPTSETRDSQSGGIIAIMLVAVIAIAVVSFYLVKRRKK
jgi:hypothetical protein